jgi:hypothetical protein
MRSWWTKLALDKFEERTTCFVQQYSSYALDGQNENGQRTLSNFNLISFLVFFVEESVTTVIVYEDKR